ncbi:hypothetical protein JYU34_008522 [Plutella xylostella]|uniref:Dynein heavy chain 3 AAA+ lid domain-containing protein n=1 Tax=Plutella xylostella TaxID=51655 RepID=A0ABQ7QMF6_PLUXY|nr:hypothetical protein JYU34_008522 [Plutella xylostella]
MSAHTSAANVQDTIESRLEKRTKGNYVPAGGKTLLVFIDDMNMPVRDEYGSQPPLELLRLWLDYGYWFDRAKQWRKNVKMNMPVRDEYGSQPPLELLRLWLDYGYWFDRAKQWRKNVKGMVVCGAVGPPGGARSPLPPRLLSCFHALYLTAPSHSQLVKIFGTMLNQHLQVFDEETKAVGKLVLLATIDMFNIIEGKLLPTPSKMHYLFNLRDISKIFQGLLRSNKDYQNTKTRFLKLWIHECFRVFSDRLTDEKDRSWFFNLAADTLGKHMELTFAAVCPTKEPPLFGHFLNPYDVYDDLADPDALRK